jgi:hypothetical protein
MSPLTWPYDIEVPSTTTSVPVSNLWAFSRPFSGSSVCLKPRVMTNCHLSTCSFAELRCRLPFSVCKGDVALQVKQRTHTATGSPMLTTQMVMRIRHTVSIPDAVCSCHATDESSMVFQHVVGPEIDVVRRRLRMLDGISLRRSE